MKKHHLLIISIILACHTGLFASEGNEYIPAIAEAKELCGKSNHSFEQGHYDTALKFSNECLKKFSKKADPRWVSSPGQKELLEQIAYAHFLQAQCYEQLKDFDKAEQTYNLLNTVYRNVFHDGDSYAVIASEKLANPKFADLVGATAEQLPEFSKAGFFDLPESGREAANFNIGWRFKLGDAKGAHSLAYDDGTWPLVNVPHGLEFLPLEASGSQNYQGVVWYRKRFTMPKNEKGRKHFIHFEAIMGKSEVWINGHSVKKHFGGFLPIAADISEYLHYDGSDNVIAVRADNSDDPSYPPGKMQKVMDFTYFGGIYRDAWLVSHNQIYVTDPHAVDKEAGGGVFVHYENLSSKEATVGLKVDVANDSSRDLSIQLKAILKNREGDVVGETLVDTTIPGNQAQEVLGQFTVTNPHLWEPDNPYLHDLCIQILDDKGIVLDGVRNRIGLRTIEFKGKDGFFLNGKYYPEKLIGGNRHQDFAHIGNALPNSLHCRDAKKMRNLGFRVVRAAHYPQDPAFMDACDAMGLFVITATPGWQFWNDAPIFEERVISDIRQMIRRDRNRPCILLWETSLNESHFPETFSRRSQKVTHLEYPYPGAYTSADPSGHRSSFNSDVYDVLYHGMHSKSFDQGKNGFQREWGDNVDNWLAHNSTSRVALEWGERPMLVQALHYAGSMRVPHEVNLHNLYKAPKPHVGGTMWHTFDHQRGYHPDPFWGGIMDAFRQPKTSLYMFDSQRPHGLVLPTGKTGPMVHIAHEVTPFSDDDVWVFSNCDEVRLSVMGNVIGTQTTRSAEPGLPHPPVVFKDVFDWQTLKETEGVKNRNITAEGIIDGKVVAKSVKMCAQQKSKLVLKIDDEQVPITANGSDLLTVVAYMEDDYGNIKRLVKDQVQFTVSGEGFLWDEEHLHTVPLVWGRAPNLIRSSTTPGEIFIKAELVSNSLNGVQDATLRVRTIASPNRLLFKEEPHNIRHQLLGLKPELGLEEELKKVGAQQDQFLQ